MACGRNPWKRASVEDATFRAYLKDPHFLSSILPISGELEVILRRIFECNPAKRISISGLRELILSCDSFIARPKAPPITPVDYQPQVYEPPVVVQPYDNSYEALFTPPPSPPASDPFSKPPALMDQPEVFVDSDSDYDSDNDSCVSRASSVSDFDELAPGPAPQYVLGIVQSNYYCLPPDPWTKPTAYSHVNPSISCH